MTSIEASVIANVVTGLAGLLAGFLVPVLWKRVGRPWIENLLNRGARIDGLWLTRIDFPDGEYNKHRMTLKHTGHSVSGEILCTEGYSEGQEYRFDGTLRNSILTVTYQIKDENKIERGALALVVKRDAQVLDGHLIYYESNTENTNTAPCKWERQ